MSLTKTLSNNLINYYLQCVHKRNNKGLNKVKFKLNQRLAQKNYDS